MARLWPGETVVCLASGPSLADDDVAFVRGKARVIAINTSYLKAPWADVLYAADEKWWRWQKENVSRGQWPDFEGLRFSLTRGSAQYGATVLQSGLPTGLSLEPTHLNRGHNSGYQAINLAVLLGASRIVLLGYDMQPGPKLEQHWHADHPDKSGPNFELFKGAFSKLVEPLQHAKVEIVNCTRRTALTCFRRADLRETFSKAVAA